MGLLQSTPFSSQAKVGCKGITSKPNLGVLNGGGISPSIGRGVHAGVGVMAIAFPASVVVVVAVAIVSWFSCQKNLSQCTDICCNLSWGFMSSSRCQANLPLASAAQQTDHGSFPSVLMIGKRRRGWMHVLPIGFGNSSHHFPSIFGHESESLANAGDARVAICPGEPGKGSPGQGGLGGRRDWRSRGGMAQAVFRSMMMYDRPRQCRLTAARLFLRWSLSSLILLQLLPWFVSLHFAVGRLTLHDGGRQECDEL